MQISGSDLFFRFTIQYCSIALLFYDYTLTLTDEIKYFWFKKFKISTALYIACRYAMVSNVLFTLALANKFPHLGCNNTYKLCAALSVIGRSAIVFVWGIRTFAVYNKSKWTLVILAPLGVAVIGLDISHVPWVTCDDNPGNSIVDSFLLVFMVVYESLAAFLATFRIWQASRISEFRDLKGSGLMHLILREGLFYFSSVSIATLIAFILLLTSNGSFFQRLLNALTLPMSGLLTARFLIHLRRWVAESNGNEEDSWDQSRIPLDILKSVEETTPQSIVNEFGEDPVLRERKRQSIPV